MTAIRALKLSIRTLVFSLAFTAFLHSLMKAPQVVLGILAIAFLIGLVILAAGVVLWAFDGPL